MPFTLPPWVICIYRHHHTDNARPLVWVESELRSSHWDSRERFFFFFIQKKKKVQQYGLQHPENKHCSTALRIPAPASLSLCMCVFPFTALCVSLCPRVAESHIDLYWFWQVSFLLNQSTVQTGLCSSPCIVHSFQAMLWIYFQESSQYIHVFNRCTMQKHVNNMQVIGDQNKLCCECITDSK